MTHVPSTGQRTAAHDPVITPLATLLWVLVLLGLAYGVWSTLGKVVDLFG
jgi:hypothetical protein